MVEGWAKTLSPEAKGRIDDVLDAADALFDPESSGERQAELTDSLRERVGYSHEVGLTAVVLHRMRRFMVFDVSANLPTIAAVAR